MKVLHLFKTYLPDSFTGVERVIFEIAEGTAPLGVESKVLTLSTQPAQGPLAIGQHEVHQVRQNFYVASTGISLQVFSLFKRLAGQADIIHYHFPWPMMDLLHLLDAPNRPTIVTYHSDVVRQAMLLKLYSPLMHKFLRSVDQIVATSPNYADNSPVLRRYAGKVTTVPIGLPDGEEAPPATVEKWRAQVGERFFLFVGALRYYKGLPFLIEAARRTGLPLVVVGGGELKHEIEKAALPNVVLVGKVSEPDKAALLSLCTAFVFASHLRSEAFGVALLEAARAGRPMISCEIGTGTSYVNLHGETGLVVPPGDSTSLASAMHQVWNDPVRAAAFGRQARARYEALFTRENMAAGYSDLYSRVFEVGQRRGASIRRPFT